ncbi:MAG TPA: hypothetical protein ACHBX0_12680 [Arsenophonus sp.]
MVASKRLFVKITRESLPYFKDKYPFIYLERERLEINDSSLKWLDAEGNIVRLPVAMLNAILLEPGKTLTHEAVKTVAAANCAICWFGEDSLLFYAAGFQPTENRHNLHQQAMISCNRKAALEVAWRIFAYRFPDANLTGKSLKEMMCMEGARVRAPYQQKAQQYGVGARKAGSFPRKDGVKRHR